MKVDPWVFQEAISSVSLSHEEDCVCLTCRAASGDKRAWAEMYAAIREREA